MTQQNANPPEQEAAFLRAEARVALMAGGLTMLAGLALVFVLTGMSLRGELPAWAPAAYGAAPVLIGWAGVSYGAWRFEQAATVGRGRRPRRLYLGLSAKGVLRRLKRRLKSTGR